MDRRGMNVVALVKKTDRFVFLYDDESRPMMLQTLGRYDQGCEGV